VSSTASSIEAVLQDLIPLLTPSPRTGPGRKPILPATLLWAGMLVCHLRGDTTQRAVWRLLTVSGLWDYPLLDLSDDAIYRRLERAGPGTMAAFFQAVTALLAATGPVPLTGLAPFATGVYVIDESTLDPIARRLEGDRARRRRDPALIPGKIGAVFDVCRQRFTTIQLSPHAQENEKVPARDLLATIPPGALVLADLGYFSFRWFDDLTDGTSHWISRLRRDTRITERHTLWAAGGCREVIGFLGCHRSTRSKYAVRILEVKRGETVHRYATNVLDPRVLTMREVVQLYGRRWDIELALKLVKGDLGLGVLWSAKWEVLSIQLWGALTIAQIASVLRVQVAEAAEVELEAVSMALLMRHAPRLMAQGIRNLPAFLAHRKAYGGFIRPSRRIRWDAPEPATITPLPPTVSLRQVPRYSKPTVPK
jgi:hypothetical protein